MIDTCVHGSNKRPRETHRAGIAERQGRQSLRPLHLPRALRLIFEKPNQWRSWQITAMPTTDLDPDGNAAFARLRRKSNILTTVCVIAGLVAFTGNFLPDEWQCENESRI